MTTRMPYIPNQQPAQPEEERKDTGKKPGKGFRLILLILSVLLIGYGSVRLIQYLSELAASNATSRELQEINQAAESAEQTAQETEETETQGQAAEQTGENGEADESVSDLTSGQAEESSPAAEENAEPSAETPAPAAQALVVSDSGEEKPAVLEPVPYPDNPKLYVPARFRELRRKSGYIVGWLSMDELEEAVALKDNTFFLTHDAMGKRNSNGAIFLDADINLLTRPYTVILYGHNMKSGNMFGRLRKYKDIAYLNHHLIISFDSLYEEGDYAVFAVAVIETNPASTRWFDFWALSSNQYTVREQAIRRLEALSFHGSVLDVQADEQILLLVTCTDGDSERLIVAARRLREGETEKSLTFRQGR